MYYNQQQPQYNQNIYQQSMQPQMGYAMNGQIAMNNAPVASMPANVSQTGIPRDKMRQDMANYIVSNQNLDTAAAYIAKEASGPVGNWQTGFFDKIVTRLMTTTDFLWATKGQQMGIDAVYNAAIEETWNFSWVSVIVANPSYYMQDPNIAAKGQVVEYLRQQLAARLEQFNQYGLNTNNAPMNVNPVNTPGYQNRPQGMYGAQQQFSQQRPQQHTPVAYTNQNASLESVYGDTLKLSGTGASYSQPATTTNTVQSTTPYMSHQSLNTTTTTTNTVANAPSKPVDYRYGVPDSVKSQGMGNLKQPHEVAAQPVQHQSVEVKPFKADEFDFTDEKAVEQVFRHIQKEDTTTLGLKDDEVRFLTKAEQHEAWLNGTKFEEPYYYPLCPSPFTHYLHVVLTNKGTIRQYLTPIEEKEKLEYSEHQCVLDELRNNPHLQKQKPEVLRPYDFTTMGGVVHDRWQDAPINLEINLDKANQAESDEEKEKLIKAAYDTFVEDAKREEKEYHSGVAEWKRNNPDEAKDGFGPSEFALPPSKQEENENLSRSKDKVIYKDLFDEYLPPLWKDTNIETTLEENLPVVTDELIVDTFTTTEKVEVFNHYEEKEKVEEALADFYWKAGETHEHTGSTFMKFSEALKEQEDKIPSSLFERLNTIATDSVNDSLRYIFGSTLAIDSFVDDARDLLEYLGELESNGSNEYPNITYATRMMSLNLLTALRTLNRDDEDDDASADNKLVRVIVSKMNNIMVSVPQTARVNGILKSGDAINKDDHPDLWRILFEQYTKVMKSQNDSSTYDRPFHNIYITFTDGATFKVLPNAAKAKNISELTELEVPLASFSLVKLRAC